MERKPFKIEPKNVYNADGGVIGVAEKAMIYCLGYQLFSPTIPFYFQYLDAEGVQLRDGNITVNTPENWGTDDTVAVDAAKTHLNIVQVVEEEEEPAD
jgi:hypothetical protein